MPTEPEQQPPDPSPLDELFAGSLRVAPVRTSCARCGDAFEGSVNAGRNWFRDHSDRCGATPGAPPRPSARTGRR